MSIYMPTITPMPMITGTATGMKRTPTSTRTLTHTSTLTRMSTSTATEGMPLFTIMITVETMARTIMTMQVMKLGFTSTSIDLEAKSRTVKEMVFREASVFA